MKTTINKSAKRVLSLTLAFAMLLGSLFIANIGVSLKADAADATADNLGNVVYWDDGTVASAAASGTGTESDPYIIKTAAQLAWAVKQTTADKYYKVDDSVDTIVLQTKEYADANGITGALTADSAKAALSVETGRTAWNNGSGTFAGHFDGNGVSILGMYSTSSLFYKVTQGAYFTNFRISNSFVNSDDVASAIFCKSVEVTGVTYTIEINRVEISNCYVQSTKNSNEKVGLFAAQTLTWTATNNMGIVIDNCLAYGNVCIYDAGATKTAAGIVGTISNFDSSKETATLNTQFNNSLILGIVPWSVWTNGANAVRPASFTGIYTDTITPTPHAVTLGWDTWDKYTGVTVVDPATLVGSDASFSLLGFDFSTDKVDATWYANADGYPTPVKPVNWVYPKPSSDTWDGISSSTGTTFTSGDGSKENPFIIDTAEQLYKMVLDGGRDTAGKPAYYKVADEVKTFYLSGNLNKTAAELKTIAEKFAVTDNLNWRIAPANLKEFVGNFDGNGVTIKGMISKGGDTATIVGFIPWLGRGAVVKNINFDGCAAECYSEGSTSDNDKTAGILSSQVTAYNAAADSTLTNTYTLVQSVSVVNSYSGSTYLCGGIVCAHDTPKNIVFVNCLYDGTTSSMHPWKTTVSEGIFSNGGSTNNVEMYGCVSIGQSLAYETATNYNDYTNTKKTSHPVFIKNSYSTVDITSCSTDIVVSAISGSSEADLMAKLPLLDWANGWQAIKRTDGTYMPMPRENNADMVLGTELGGRAVLDYNKALGTQLSTDGNSIGANLDGVYPDGTYGYFYNFEGKGTEADPYIIKTGLDLARAIGSGGKNLDQKLYFKLACDIDLGGVQWLNAVGYRAVASTEDLYTYVPFEGTLDGDGHTITGLYAVSANGSEAGFEAAMGNAGLIPVMAGGTVKNLHIRDSYVGAQDNSEVFYAGAIAGSGSGTIEGCSVADSVVYNKANSNNNNLTGVSLTLKNCYDTASDLYYSADGAEMPASVFARQIASNKDAWYLGGNEGSVPRLVSLAETMPCADVDGDGLGEEYTAADLTSLRNNLLRKSAYKYVYGDVNGDGAINVGDLAVLKRAMTDGYAEVADGFWRNLELGNIQIYYGENDNYDAARKIELYLENVSGLDVQKNASYTVSSGNIHPGEATGNPDGKLDVIVGNVGSKTTALTGNQYRISYDANNCVLWLEGANFTAVEQAVLDFINNSNTTKGEPKATNALTLADEKQPTTVDGSTYYYVWGDEFEGTGVNYSDWIVRQSHSETTAGGEDAKTNFLNQEVVSASALNKLVTVSDGKLSLKRGYRIDKTGVAESDTYGWVGITEAELGDSNGYTAYDDSDIYIQAGMLTTADSMLMKQGYVEIKASLPADGHAFPALWLYGAGSSHTFLNRGFENSLFGKIYSKNTSWNGTDNIDWANTATQKYNYPENFYELDIIEIMQSPGLIGVSEAGHLANSGLHKEVATWDKYVDYYKVDTTIHKWNRTGTSSSLMNVKYDFGTPIKNEWESVSAGNQDFPTGVYTPAHAGALSDIQAERVYGFLWKVNGSNTTLKTYIYNADGTLLKTLDATISGTAINEYMQIIVDNEYYTANYTNDSEVSMSDPLQFSDLLSKVSGKYAKTSLDIDYVRVYQLDGKRDIVTRETESFNTGNHFGY